MCNDGCSGELRVVSIQWKAVFSVIRTASSLCNYTDRALGFKAPLLDLSFLCSPENSSARPV